MPAVNLGTSVIPGSNAQVRPETAGAAILAGQAVYKNPSDQRVYLAVTTSQITAACIGIAISSAPTAGQKIFIVWEGDVEGTATLVQGESYHVCDTAGSLDISTAVGSGDWCCYVGGARSASILRIRVNQLGVQHAA
jgi:hypothetical protein